MATANTVVYNGPIPGSVGPVAPDGQQAITVPDYFSSYFPYTATGGTTNPMTGLDLVQGQQPQDLGLDLILAGIQSQYTPQTFTTSGGSYGAGRFITNPLDAGGDGTNVGGAVTPPAPWFTPGEFNLADYQNTVAPEAAERIATGTVYGDSNVSPVDSVSDTGWLSDPYAGLDPISDAARQAIGSVIPGAGMIIGAGQGYTGATATNTLNDVLGYLGQDGFGNISPAKASVLGAFGITPESIKDAQDFYAIFDKDAATMLNWAALPMDTATNQIVDFLMEGAQNPLSPQDIGVMAFAVGTDINKAVVEGKSLTDAVRDVAISKGVSPTTAAEMGVQASRSAVTNALAQGLTLEDIDPAAVAVYNDPLGALIDALGITGRIDESLTEQLGALDYATPDDISDALSALDYSTPDDISTALAELDFATPDDISTALSALDYSTPDDISTALAELDFATADDIDTAISGLNFATADDIVNALADLNFTTPDDMAAALENLDFATPQDVIDGLANAGYATTDEIADAIAGLDIPTVDDIVSAIATPVTETPLAPVTEIPPFDEVGPPLPPGYVAEESQVPELFVPIDDPYGIDDALNEPDEIPLDDFFNLPEGVNTLSGMFEYMFTDESGNVSIPEGTLVELLDGLVLDPADYDQMVNDLSPFVQPSGGEFFLTDSQGNYITAAGQAYDSAQKATQAVMDMGGSVTQAQAESIANQTSDPIAALNAIMGWTVAPAPAPPSSSGGGGGDYSSYSGAGESQTQASLQGYSEHYG